MSFKSYYHLIFTFVACIGSMQPVVAQYPPWETFVEQLYTEAREYEGISEEAIVNLYEEYSYLHANPININSADSTTLKSLGFLTDWQIEGIHYYIHKYGKLQSIGELMLIPQLDYHTRQLLSYFVFLGPTEREGGWQQEWSRMVTQGRSELSTRMDIPLYQRAGYAPRTLSQLENSPSYYYMGNAIYHNLRYNYRYGTDLSWGICTEKDAGEPIFSTAHPLPDYISGYLQIGNRGILKNLVIGNYRLHCGQGLVISSNFSLGKTMLLQRIGEQTTTVTPHRGTGEDGYYTGIATILAWKTWELTTFASYRQFDATLDGVAIRTLKTDGYHRTATELTRKGNTCGNLFGAHLGYASHGFHIGMTTTYQSFNRNLAIPTAQYKQYAPQGHSFINLSADYAWHHHRISFLGETAFDGKGATATLNMMRLKAIDNLHFTLLQRYYAHNYWALEGKSISISSDIRNERGIYLGAEWQPYYSLQLTAYIDTYHFPFLRYQVSSPSYGMDGIVTMHYAVNEKESLSLHYRYRLKQRDIAEGYRLPNGGLLNEWTHRLKAQWGTMLTPTLSIKMQTEGCAVTAETLSIGYTGSLQVTYELTFGKHSLRISSGGTAFKTDYATRIYGYERGLLYAYNYQMFYGDGIRSYLLLQYRHKQTQRLTTAIKIGSIYYYDRSTIGTNANLITSNHKEDIQIQIRYAF